MPPSTFPAPLFREHVLTHVFADAQRLFLDSLLSIDEAHLVMLREQGIVSAETARACMQALHTLDRDRLRSLPYDGSVEDLFFLLEQQLAALAGADHAGRLHTARSRNDIDLTLYRIALRGHLLAILGHTLALRGVLLRLARQHASALMPAWTHNQPAQPTTLGHYLMAVVEILERDADRLLACYTRVNRCPLGACAITTTGFPIDRHRTADLLGFQGLVINSYGAIAAVDYLAEAAGVLAACMLSLGRFTQDLLLWSTAEFNLLRLSAAYVQISSIMPQKRNPVPLEHVRILSSRALNEAQSLLGSLHNTPFADSNDAEDSLQPLVSLSFSDAARALALLAGILSEATFHTGHMRDRAHRNFLTVTEAADTLVRDAGLSFREAHALVAAAVQAAPTDDLDALARDLHARAAALGVTLSLTHLQQALDPAHFVAIRNRPGGPSAASLLPELDRADILLDEHRARLHAEQAHLDDAASRLAQASGRLLIP